MSRLHLTVACGPYDRTRALVDGRVAVSGVDLTYVSLDPEEIFFRMLHFQEFDASEMSLSTYLLTHLADGPFVALPVFPSRAFRHSGVYVSAASGLAGAPPARLAGGTVGVAEYQLTANVWIRGLLAERHGLPVESVRYRTGGLNSTGRHEKFQLALPPEIDIAPASDDLSLSALLAGGRLDAIYSPRAPASFPGPQVARLFADPRAEEEAYVVDTGIFPIMHVLVLRRDVYERHPWVAVELLKAFERAKALAYEDLSRTVSLALVLPWVREEHERTMDLMGEDYWSYGLAANRAVLETFVRYAAEQGLVDRQPAPEELFARETLDRVII